MARVTAPDGTVTYRRVPATGRLADGTPDVVLPDRAQLAAQLSRAAREPFATDHLVVVFAGGAAPRFTPDPATNRALARAGIVSESRLFASLGRGYLDALSSWAASAGGVRGPALANAYRLDIATGDPVSATQKLLELPGVELASLDWKVEPTGTTTSLSTQAARSADAQAAAQAGSPHAAAEGLQSWRDNFGIRSSAQSFWNTPGLDAAAAFDEIVDRFHVLPGRGQVITDVGLGDLTDDNPGIALLQLRLRPDHHSAGRPALHRPALDAARPDVHRKWWLQLDPLGEVCGPDPLLRSIGHDLSVMAPLPRDLQRPGRQGHGLTDLLGLAPGARYRVVVPASDTPDVSDVSAALLAAATQNPRPDVITTGIVASGDGQGFPERYLEQDPLA